MVGFVSFVRCQQKDAATAKLFDAVPEPQMNAVFELDIETGKKSSLCTATAWKPDLLITASHCVAASQMISIGKSEVSKFVTHPRYVSGLSTCAKYDIALLWLEDGEFATRDVAFDGVPIGAEVTLVGFGDINSTGASAGKRSGTNHTIDPNLENIPGDYDVDNMWVVKGQNQLVGTSNTSTRPGDSGGPLLYKNKLVGILFGGPETEDQTAKYSLYSKLSLPENAAFLHDGNRAKATRFHSFYATYDREGIEDPRLASFTTADEVDQIAEKLFLACYPRIAIALYERYQHLWKSVAEKEYVAIRKADIYIRSGNTQDAIIMLNQISRHQYRNVFNVASFYELGLGDRESAYQVYTDFLKISPESHAARLNRVKILAKMGRDDDVILECSRVIDHVDFSTNKQGLHYSLALRLRSQAYLRKGQKEKSQSDAHHLRTLKASMVAPK